MNIQDQILRTKKLMGLIDHNKIKNLNEIQITLPHLNLQWTKKEWLDWLKGRGADKKDLNLYEEIYDNTVFFLGEEFICVDFETDTSLHSKLLKIDFVRIGDIKDKVTIEIESPKTKIDFYFIETETNIPKLVLCKMRNTDYIAYNISKDTYFSLKSV